MTATENEKFAMVARFASTCSRCNGKIEVGETLEKCGTPSGRNLWVHVNCSAVGAGDDGAQKKSRIDYTCVRCGQRVAKGGMVERWVDGPRRGKQRHWVHVGCSSVAPVTPSPTSGDDIKSLLAEMLQKVDLSGVDSAVDSKIAESEARLAERMGVASEIILKAVDDKLSELQSARPIEIKTPSGDVRRLDGLRHEAFDELLELAMMREEILLPGPAGCGKSHIASQINDALFGEERQFGMLSCSAGMSEGQLLGRLIPTGANGSFEYHRSEFVRCYEDGGVFLCDEIDAADSNVLLVLNAALANGKCAVPNRTVKPYAKRHEDFIFVAAANTYGRGADRLYCGRNELDEATLDRFRAATIAMDYDRKLEQSFVNSHIAACGCPEKSKTMDDLLRAIWAWRDAVMVAKLERIVSTRFLLKCLKGIAMHGWSVEKCQAKLTAGWSQDETKKL